MRVRGITSKHALNEVYLSKQEPLHQVRSLVGWEHKQGQEHLRCLETVVPRLHQGVARPLVALPLPVSQD